MVTEPITSEQCDSETGVLKDIRFPSCFLSQFTHSERNQLPCCEDTSGDREERPTWPGTEVSYQQPARNRTSSQWP